MLSLIVIESKHSLGKSFSFAFQGVKTAVTKGRNFRIQLGLFVLAALLGLILKLELAEWLALILVSTFVLIMELVNTSLEAITDLVSPEIAGSAKIAKDVAAAAVLISSFSAILVGALIFLPKIL